MTVNITIYQNLDTTKQFLRGKPPRTWESPTQKYAGITTQKLFEVIYKLALVERTQGNICM